MIQPTVFLTLLLIIIAAFSWSVRSRAAADRRSAAARAAFDARITRLAQGCGDRLLVAIEHRMERGRNAHEVLLGDEVVRVNAEIAVGLIALGRRISRVETAQDEAAAAAVGSAMETLFLFRERELAARRARGYPGGTMH